MKRFASRSIAGGSVAENIMVRRALGQLLQDVLDLRQEAEVEHVVGLVEHQVLDAVETQVAAPDVIEQPPGRCDHELGAALLERVDLPLHADATDERRAAQAHLVAHHRHELGRLVRDLARGADDQRLHAVLGLDHVEQREHERRGLTGAGLRQPDHVAAFEREPGSPRTGSESAAAGRSAPPPRPARARARARESPAPRARRSVVECRAEPS